MLSGQCYLDQKGQSYCGQKGQFFLAKGVKFVWLFQSFLKSIIQKAKKWFPLFQELVYMEKFCLKVGFNERQAATLISGKPLFYEGELYSEEHRRKFTTEEAGFQVVKDPKDKSKLALAINGQVIGEWFKEQFGRLFSSVKRTVEPLRRGKGMGL